MSAVVRVGWSFVVAAGLAACGGGNSPPPAGSDAPASALAASKTGDLLEHVKALVRARAQQRAANPQVPIDLPGAPAAPLPVNAAGTPVHSNTTVQEAGVDEEDLLKTDGTDVFALDTTADNGRQMRLQVWRRQSDGSLALLQTVVLPADTATYPMPRGLLLAAAARRLAVISESLTPIAAPLPCDAQVCPAPGTAIFAPIAMRSHVQVQFADLGAAGATLTTRLTLDGRLIGSRLVGSVLYLVTSHTPLLPVDQLPAATPAAEREALLARLTAADFLPALRADGGPGRPLVAETDCYLQPRNTSLALAVTTITAIDLGAGALPQASRCFVGGTESVYASAANLYLATTRSGFHVLQSGAVVYRPQFATDIHKFAYSGLGIDYRASGEVGGHLGWDLQRKSYRMGEHNGDLRVLSYTGTNGWATRDDATRPDRSPPSPATLTVLRERAADKSLQVIATLPNAQRPEMLGKPGEQVYAVRFAGERGYLVTFRQVDPLYVLDLANPADPRVAGVLEVPGFSDYLFPLPGGLLLGVGKDADAQGMLGGAKVALFDVLDAQQPKAIAEQVLGSRGSVTALDYSSHGLNLMMQADTARIALPMRLASGTSGTTVQQGLYRFEVDTTTRRLASLPPVPSPSQTLFDLWGERSLQIDSMVVYLTQGTVLTAAW
jgi:hypothetical protein